MRPFSGPDHAGKSFLTVIRVDGARTVGELNIQIIKRRDDEVPPSQQAKSRDGEDDKADGQHPVSEAFDKSEALDAHPGASTLDHDPASNEAEENEQQQDAAESIARIFQKRTIPRRQPFLAIVLDAPGVPSGEVAGPDSP